ncbi:hypothetical protein BKA66DRAFT_207071 [Pyrenochaeta sp. MPI-SDFR-AT-0127]|nr:hypothetical protein BKA66DRAFT_207071 [Pyrenochaeta sp. MPI-SDFR-AT-0127]
MIKKVMNDQELVMKKILCWRRQTSKDGAGDAAQGIGFVHQPLEQFTLLEVNAKRVRHRITTLLDIWQREATIDESVENSRQSRVILVFTIVTVVFVPLSFSQQLLALPIREFDKDYPAMWVTKVAGMSSLIVLNTGHTDRRLRRHQSSPYCVLCCSQRLSFGCTFSPGNYGFGKVSIH